MQRCAPDTSNAAALLGPGSGNWGHTNGGMNATPGSASAGPSRAQVPKGGPHCAPHLGAERRPSSPRPARHRHAPRADPTLFPPHRTRPAALTSRPDPAETQLRYRRKSANGNDGRARPRAAVRAAGPAMSMRQPPGAMLAWGGVKPACRLSAQEFKGDPWLFSVRGAALL